MCERSPSYFESFRKKIRFKMVDQKPIDVTSFINYAFSPNFDFQVQIFQLATIFFYLLIDISTKLGVQSKANHLLSPAFSKLKSAVDFNDKTREKIDSTTVHLFLPVFLSAKAKTKTLRELQRRQSTMSYQQQPAMSKLKLTKYVQNS